MNMKNPAHLWGDSEHSLTWEAVIHGEASIKLMAIGSAVRMDTSGPLLQFEYFPSEEAFLGGDIF